MRRYLELMRFHKPIGIFLLLWPTWIALWMAGEGHPDGRVVLIFTLGVVVMRSAGCVVNDLLDRKFDQQVTRTQRRPLAAGSLSVRQAGFLFLGLVVLAFLLALQLNRFTLLLSFLAIGLAIFYPTVKRFSHYPQVVLGAAFGMGIPMAFTALTNSLPWQGIWLFIAILCWTVVYDTQYAMADREEDLKAGVKSTAIAFGNWDKRIIGILQLLVLGMLWELGHHLQWGCFYQMGLAIAACLSVYQQWLIRNREASQCFKAFLNNHYFGAALFLGLFLDFWWRGV